MRYIKKENKSKQYIVGSLIIVILLILTVIPISMFSLVEIVKGQGDAPTVNTNATTSIYTTSATLNGYLQLNGSTRTWYGIRYGLSNDSLTNNNTVGTDGANGTAFNYGATGLNEGTVYFVQAWANNTNGFSTGSVKAFWTNSSWANSSLSNRTKITINHSFIDEELYDFPILVAIDSTVSQHCDSGNSIRFYKNSTVQYYYEIDTWNTSENSSVWVNVTLVYKDINTIFYMYYNNTNAVDDSSNKTWDGYYLGVYHMNEIGGVECNDSTSNDNNGTYFGDLPTRVVGNIGYAQYLDGTDDYISFPAGCWMTGYNSFGTQEVYIKNTVVSDMYYILQWDKELKNRTYFKTTSAKFYAHGEANGSAQWVIENVGNVQIDEGYHIALSMKKDNVKLVVNGSVVGADSSCNMPSTSVANMQTIQFGSSATGLEKFNGTVDEIRISNISRSEAWISASYDTMNQTPGLLTFEKLKINSEFLIKGLPNNRLTWQGLENTNVWCNATGSYYETLEINMSVTINDNITELRIWISDLNDTGDYLNASNISIVISSDNTSWAGGDGSVNLTTYTDGGSNVTINTTYWTDANGMYGTNPFSGAGITNKSVSIYGRFKLNIPLGQTNVTYWNGTQWKVFIGVT